jgi:hypothetical protein
MNKRSRVRDDIVRRFSRCRKVLIQSGCLKPGDISSAFWTEDWDAKEIVARWLRTKLKELRESERVPGRAPVIRGVTLSRLVISDIAMSMVGTSGSPLGEELLALLEELLNVDRHRAAEDAFPSERFRMATLLEGELAAEGEKIGVRKLAKLVGVNPSTITVWKRRPEYSEWVESHKRSALKPNYRSTVKELKIKISN